MIAKFKLAIAILCFAILTAQSVFAQEIGSGVTEALKAIPGSTSSRIVEYLVLLSVLSIAPGLVVMVTSFTRIVVAFSFLRSSIGLQTTPANIILISLALFMTMFVMSPVFEKSWKEGIAPFRQGQISEDVAYQNITEPFREFMLKNVREKELALFQSLAEERNMTEITGPKDFRILIPAFMTSELRRGFEIGFLIAIPFLIIDLVVATVSMAMGMMMLPPTLISLPLKVLFFILVDGWGLLVGSLVRSFA